MELVTGAGLSSRIAAFFKRSRQPVVYAVRLEVDPGIIQEYDEWLLLHVREMLAFPGFQSARVYRGRELTADNRVVRIAAYEVRSQRELDSYLRTHAARMRKDGQRRFGTQFSASRQIVPAEEYSPPADMTVLYGEQEITGGLPLCANCHHPVEGRFCGRCGQEDRTYLLSLFELAGEFIGELFNYDSRFFRTLRPLLFRPGFLTCQYILGKRHHYLSPVRLYIFISLLFFFFFALLTDIDFEQIRTASEGDVPVAAGQRDLTEEERAEVARALRDVEQKLDLPPGLLDKSGQQAPPTEDRRAAIEAAPAEQAEPQQPAQFRPSVEFEGDKVEVSGFGSPEVEARLERGARALQKNPKAFVQAAIQQIPTMMFVFLPLIALALKLFYVGSRRYYTEHLIFTLHFHSAVFLLLLFWLLFLEARTAWSALEPVSPWITAAVWLYIPYYLFRSLRVVYGQGRFVTLLKFVMLQAAYFTALLATFVLMLLFTMYQQA